MVSIMNGSPDLVIPYTTALKMNNANAVTSFTVYLAEGTDSEKASGVLEEKLDAMFSYEEDCYTITTMSSIEDTMNEMLSMAHEKEFDIATFDRLKKDLEKGGKMVFLTDNCGEVVLDMLLIEEMKKQYPLLDITVIVKGQEAVNDATMEDAKQIGLDQLVTVIGNGNNVGASWIPEMPEDVISVIEEADIIFSKGQANFETLRHCERNAYYLFLCKCDMFANQFQVEPFTGMFIHESDSKNGILE